jgi:hypothetical protein
MTLMFPISQSIATIHPGNLKVEVARKFALLRSVASYTYFFFFVVQHHISIGSIWYLMMTLNLSDTWLHFEHLLELVVR